MYVCMHSHYLGRLKLTMFPHSLLSCFASPFGQEEGPSSNDRSIGCCPHSVTVGCYLEHNFS